MIGGADMFAACAHGEQQPYPDWSDMPDWVGNDPAASYRRATAGVVAAFSAPGVLDRTVPMPWGDTPAPFALNLIMADHATHSWDLARATGLSHRDPGRHGRNRPGHHPGLGLARVPRRRPLRGRAASPPGRVHAGSTGRLQRTFALTTRPPAPEYSPRENFLGSCSSTR